MMDSLQQLPVGKAGYWPKIKIQLLMNIEFGMPSMRCKKFGICQMVPLQGKGIIQKRKGRNSAAIVTIYSADHIEIDFFKSSLDRNTYDRFFSQNVFLMQEAFVYTSAEQPSHNYRIRAGAYPILENASLIKVVFKSTLPGRQ